MPNTSGLNADLLLAATRGPQVEDMSVVRQRMQAQQLQAEQLKGAQLENKTHQNQLDQTEAINKAYRDSLTIGTDGTPTIDKGKITKVLGAAGHGSAIPGILKGILETEKSSQELANSKLTGQKTAGEIGEQEANFAGDLGATVKAANYDPHLFLTLAQQSVASKHVEASHVQPMVEQVVSAFQQDPTGEAAKKVVQGFADQFIAGSQKQQALATARTAAEARAKTANVAESNAQEARDTRFLNMAAAAGSQQQLDQLRTQASQQGSGVSAGAVAKLPAMFSPQGMQQFGKSLLTEDQRRQGAQADATLAETQKRDAETQRHNKADEYLASLRIGQEHEISDLTPEALDKMAEMFATTGQLPSLGMGRDAAGMRAKIINRSAVLYPHVQFATNRAAYQANQASLKTVTATLDNVTAFEKTAGQNLQRFLDAAGKIPDWGSPWINTPIRLVDEKLFGSTDMSVVNAARQVALREIARITNDPRMMGQLSDSSRHEVMGLSPENATFKQIVAVAKLVTADMASVHKNLADQRDAIQSRIATAEDTITPPNGGGSPPPNGGGKGGGGGAPVKWFNPASGQLEPMSTKPKGK